LAGGILELVDVGAARIAGEERRAQRRVPAEHRRHGHVGARERLDDPRLALEPPRIDAALLALDPQEALDHRPVRPPHVDHPRLAARDVAVEARDRAAPDLLDPLAGALRQVVHALLHRTVLLLTHTLPTATCHAMRSTGGRWSRGRLWSRADPVRARPVSLRSIDAPEPDATRRGNAASHARSAIMEFQIAESMCDIGHYLPLAQAADEAGFGCFGLGDSVLYPERAVGSYPYNADGS